MKKIIISIALSLIVLMTGQVVGVSTHYCMGKAIKSDLIFGQEVAKCDMMANEKEGSALRSGKCQFNQEKCCKDISSSLEVENPSTDIIHHIKLKSNLSIAPASFFISKKAFDRQSKIVVSNPRFCLHSPDIQAFYQIFII